jgi:hypothetical protein
MNDELPSKEEVAGHSQRLKNITMFFDKNLTVLEYLKGKIDEISRYKDEEKILEAKNNKIVDFLLQEMDHIIKIMNEEEKWFEARDGKTLRILDKYCRSVIGKSEPRKCPKCSSEAVLKIEYGLPDEELSKRTDVYLGGCCITGEDPEWHCKKCRWEWGKEVEGRYCEDDIDDEDLVIDNKI